MQYPNTRLNRRSEAAMTPFKRLLQTTYLLLAGLTPVCGVQALPDDRDQIIEIESITAEFRETEGLTIYSGEVNLQQGSILLKADRLTLFAEKGRVSRLLAEGNAYYEQIPEVGADKVVARGRSIEYLLSEDVITLNQNASLTHEGATMNGNLITYDVRNNLLIANSLPGSADDRIRVVLPPINGGN